MLLKLGNCDEHVLVDDDCPTWITNMNWTRNKEGYAQSHVKRKTVLMHRLINATPEGLATDHINRVRLDNRRENLRSVTVAENNKNRTVKGTVFKTNQRGYIYWVAKYKRGGKVLMHKQFKTEAEARNHLDNYIKDIDKGA